MSQKVIVVAIIGILIAGVGVWLFFSAPKTYSGITSYNECVVAGYPVLETYPEQCKTPDGRTFTREIKSDVSDLIRVDTPQPESIVGSPLTITGAARGNWYFEAVFPVKLVDSAGNVIVQSFAQAEGEWMTTDFVPFKATLTFNPPAAGTGTLIVQNDNPSGLPEYDKELKIPVRFAGSNSLQTAAFNKPFILHTGDKVVFPDGLSFGLKEINDSRCPQDVLCIWEGEISALFSVRLGTFSQELRLGTVNSKNATLKGHVFTLQNATTESATVIVSVVPVTSGVSGIIHIGPTCPVELMPPDPACADRPYADAKITIQSNVNGSVMIESVSDKKGSFRVSLAPGTYTIDVSSPTNSPLPRCETKEATVKANEFVNVDVSCDSGIR